MWRVVVFVVLAVVFADCSLGDTKHGILLQRLKRSPYDCPPNYPPPPQPYWPPPPHWHHHRHWPPPQQYYDQPNQAYSAAQAQASATSAARSGALTQGGPDFGRRSGPGGPGGSGGPAEPCDKCNNGPNSAVSNAQSDTGNAVAVAISKGKN